MSLRPHSSVVHPSNLETRVWKVSSEVGTEKLVKDLTGAADLLKQNEVVGFPTETVYGLGGNATSNEAISKIFGAKGRPSDNPLIVHVCSLDMCLSLVTSMHPIVCKLVKAFWPGPLTVVLPVKPHYLSSQVTAGLDSVGVRMPSHPVALALIEAAGLPIAAPSANTSGRPSPTTASHVVQDLSGKIAGVVDDGSCSVIGLESTVLDCTQLYTHAAAPNTAKSVEAKEGERANQEQPVVLTILRPGGVTQAQLSQLLADDKVVIDLDSSATSENSDESKQAALQKPRAPGMKYTHYAPRAPVFLVDGSQEFMLSLVRQRSAEGHKVGVLADDSSLADQTFGTAPEGGAAHVVSFGAAGDVAALAHSLYDCLRKFDETDVTVIFAQTVPQSSCQGLGQAVMNRLLKAAGRCVLREEKQPAVAE